MKQKVLFDDQMIVITGAAGFIGSAVVRYLNDRKRNNLVLVDDLGEKGTWKNLVGKDFIEIISQKEIFHWLKGREKEIEAFIHLGACSDTLENNAEFLLENNYRFSVQLAEYALTNDHRFIYASSAATYGDGSRGFSDEHACLESYRPLNMYAFSKHLFDLWVKRENVLNQVVGLKYFNVFGPNEYHKEHMASMVYKMYRVIKKDLAIQLYKSTDPKYGDGEQLRDFIYVKDAAKMTCRLLDDAFKDVSGIFNIGRGEAVSWNRLAKALFKAMQIEEKIGYIDMPDSLAKQYQNYTCADMKKYNEVHKITGDNPDVMNIEEAVIDYVQNYLPNETVW